MIRMALSAGIVIAVIASVSFARHPDAPAATFAVDVYKTSSCNCCAKWVSLLEQELQGVRVNNLHDLNAIKDLHNVPPKLRSCHTTVAGGYVFEGHVPIDLVRRILIERPDIVGLAVPGMPIGSPGMELAGRRNAYKVIAFQTGGATYAYAER